MGNTELLFLRARWYSSETGTFLSVHLVENEPPYAYVGGNPLNLTDSSGFQGVVELTPVTICSIATSACFGAATAVVVTVGGALVVIGAEDRGINMNNKVNIFGISNPYDSECRILRYHAGHSRLLLTIGKAEQQENPIYVVFDLVKYYEGPLLWAGGDFRLGDPDEVVEILTKVRMSGVEDERVREGLLNEYKLFVGTMWGSDKVKILASTYSVQSTVPKKEFQDI